MTALLASVRSAEEAFDAARAGAELIDLKEPNEGALGALPSVAIADIARQLRARYPVKPISATIGDVPADAVDEIAARVIDVGDAGVDYVKVGVARGPSARKCIEQLANLPATVVPVLLCDGGMDDELVSHTAALGFAGMMFDTAGKDGSTLFDHVDVESLTRWLRLARSRGAMVGIAGALGWAQLQQIRALAPDVAGFRTALCADGRRSKLDPERVAQWVSALHRSGVAGAGASASIPGMAGDARM
ncbi:(5-formylfuran-3-yl)methyl phosphate synthase [Paraburkholderia sp. MMS20-SJTR3]|uniref:(5-formylfuran-3-yl)methyl phosphate synthase n=1 Tax=Paraburkholderia sejongensis TaxID=2886946 RepID=A0ABS8K1R5_9BURK|nr:(5-formylfuran-3-yl)methyl phosphate synthase [Paraburkholderia sp. MMS20-SJTR3]MCC8396087.1 (5-formylfuran-3-yl)methyl phosphate synthase [Paraburkholderia sp. MMS20-SJTR3]